MLVWNGDKSFDIQDSRDVRECLEDSGFGYFDIDNIISVIQAEYDKDMKDDLSISYKDYELEADGIQSIVNDIVSVSERLDERSKKGNTRTDLARELRNIARNLECSCGTYL